MRSAFVDSTNGHFSSTNARKKQIWLCFVKTTVYLEYPALVSTTIRMKRQRLKPIQPAPFKTHW
eukprot:gene15612-18836_t